RIENPSEVIEEGQELDLKVLKLRAQARRMTLSLVAAVQEKERQEYQKYMADQEAPATTLGDQFADVLGAVAAELDEDVGGPAKASEAESAAEATAEEAESAEGAEAAGEAEGGAPQDSVEGQETVEVEGGPEEGDEEEAPQTSAEGEAAGEEDDETEADDAEDDEQ
ncbi:MAG: hypothetical protein ACP5KN_20155, partial [Armatimonadota bacterium]